MSVFCLICFCHFAQDMGKVEAIYKRAKWLQKYFYAKGFLFLLCSHLQLNFSMQIQTACTVALR